LSDVQRVDGRGLGNGEASPARRPEGVTLKRSELEKKTVVELRKLAASRGYEGLSGLRKAELVKLLAKPTKSQAKGATGKGAPTKRAAAKKAMKKSTKKSAPRKSVKKRAAPRKSASKKSAAKRSAARGRPTTSSLSPRLKRSFSSRPRNGEQRVKASKYYLGVAESTDLDEGYAYPETHGENAMALMVRDPYWLYAYWEFAPELRGELVARIGEEALLRSRTVLRVYDVTGTEPENPVGHYDIDVAPEARNWYINVPRVEREYCVDVGLIAPDGSFIVIARSNRVSLPPVGPSDEVDEEWVTIDGLKEFYVHHDVRRGPSSGSGGWGSGGLGH
jgi:hypothetical protein